MFQEKYIKAYNNVEVSELNIDELWMRAEEKRSTGKMIFQLVQPIAVPVLSLCLAFMLIVPVLAEEIPAVYRLIQKYAPALTGYILSEEASSTSKNITLQLEAVNIQDNDAEIILSFRDAEGSSLDQIKGKVDLYDSYRIQNYGETSVIGGCSFLEYDPAADKAYFKISITSDKSFERNRVKFAVRQLLTNYTKEERRIDLTNMIEDPKEKIPEYYCGGGELQNKDKFPFFIEDSSNTDWNVRVMDVVELKEELLEDLRITGVAYDEGVLRVQQCRGNFQEADRHIMFYLKDENGNEKLPDCSASWQEEIQGERVGFDEHWFLITEEELKQYELYGMFYNKGGSVKGNWEVVVDLGK